jgi:hypothetical protein
VATDNGSIKTCCMRQSTMDAAHNTWTLNNRHGKPLLVSAPRRAGKSDLLCTIAAEHLQQGKRVCVITTRERLVSSLNDRIVAKCVRNGLTAMDTPASETITHNRGRVHCIVGRELDRIDLIAEADTILVDEMPYVDPAWFNNRLLPHLQTIPTILFGTPTSDENHFSRMLRATDAYTVALNAQ